MDKNRCGTCKSWRGGKRSALKKNESTKKNKQLPPNNRGRKLKQIQTPPAAAVAVDSSNLLIVEDDVLSPLTAVPNNNDPLRRVQLIGMMPLLIQQGTSAMMNALNCSKQKMINKR